MLHTLTRFQRVACFCLFFLFSAVWLKTPFSGFYFVSFISLLFFTSHTAISTLCFYRFFFFFVNYLFDFLCFYYFCTREDECCTCNSCCYSLTTLFQILIYIPVHTQTHTPSLALHLLKSIVIRHSIIARMGSPHQQVALDALRCINYLCLAAATATHRHK